MNEIYRNFNLLGSLTVLVPISTQRRPFFSLEVAQTDLSEAQEDVTNCITSIGSVSCRVRIESAICENAVVE